MELLFPIVLLMVFCFFVYPIIICVASWIVDYFNKNQNRKRNDKNMD